MELLTLHSLYFWIYSDEMHHKPINSTVKNDIRKLSLIISDNLRRIDDSPFMKEVLELLFLFD